MRTLSGVVVTCAAVAAMAGAAAGQGCQPAWSTNFPGGDIDGPVRSFAVFNDGTGYATYAGGTFTRAGGVHAAGVAKWTGSAWSPLGGDFDGDVNALCVHDDGTGPRVFAAGSFMHIGATSATLVAKWDGTAWVSAGAAFTGGTVRAMASYNTGTTYSSLFLGGDNLRTGPSQFGSCIMRKDGPVGGWTSSLSVSDSRAIDVRAFAVHVSGATRLYAAGASGVLFAGRAPDVLRLDGSWSALNAGLNGAGYALASYGTGPAPALYLGGDFTMVGGVGASHIAKWDGTAWSAVGAGTDGPVYALAPLDLDGPFGPGPYSLFVGGRFTHTGPTLASNFAVWDGAEWSPARGTSEAVLALGARIGPVSSIFAGGDFWSAADVMASHAAVYQTDGWHALANPSPGNAPEGPVRCAEWFDDDGAGPDPMRLYIGGDFRSIGDQPIAFLAAWDGTAWSAVGEGPGAPVYALKGFDDGNGPALYASTQTSATAAQVMRYAGGQWTTLPQTFGLLYALEAFAPAGQTPRLYAGGDYLLLTQPPIQNLASWDGSAWHPVPVGSAQVLALRTYDDGSGPALYIGGVISPMRKWDGQTVTSAAGGLDTGAVVRTFTVLDRGGGPVLYSGGLGLISQGPTAQNVARLVGGVWTTAGTGPTDDVRAMASFDDGSGAGLYAGGAFLTCGPVATPHLAKWDGSAWSSPGALGPVASATVNAMAAGSGPAGPALCVGGSFLTAAGVSSPNIAVLQACGCYANCDGSTAAPVLNVNDFICFQTRFAAGDAYANCDGSTQPPVLNVNDFICFQQRFAAGCR